MYYNINTHVCALVFFMNEYLCWGGTCKYTNIRKTEVPTAISSSFVAYFLFEYLFMLVQYLNIHNMRLLLIITKSNACGRKMKIFHCKHFTYFFKYIFYKYLKFDKKMHVLI